MVKNEPEVPTAGPFSDCADRIRCRTATVAVVGQGYVGLTVACGAAISGMTVEAIDVAPDRVGALTDGRNVVPGVADELFASAFETGRISFGTDASKVRDADVTLICVPTPVTDHRPDLSYIESAARSIAPHLLRGGLVTLVSLSYPGTTEQVLQPILEQGGLVGGEDFLLAYSPERVDPGNTKYGLRETPRVVGGLTSTSTAVSALFYAQIVDAVHPLSSCRAAELAKLLENTFRMVNIALVNELAVLCADQGIDVWEVIEAADTKPFGFMPFYPGPGVGGHCIPLDPTYLAWQSRRDTGKRFQLVETAQDINAQMPGYVATRIVDTLNERGVSVRNARILIVGVTYKPDVGDIRESAAVEVLSRLCRKGADVLYHDPFVDHLTEYGLDMHSVPLDAQEIDSFDCVAILTPHANLDLDDLARRSSLLFDARNAIRSDGPNIVRL